MKKSLFVKKQGNVDFTFLTTLIILIIFGLTMTFSASSASAHYQYNDAFYFIKRQMFFAVFGLIIMYAVSRIDLQLENHIELPQ